MKDIEYEVVPMGEGTYQVVAIRPVWLAEFADKTDAIAFAARKSGEGETFTPPADPKAANAGTEPTVQPIGTKASDLPVANAAIPKAETPATVNPATSPAAAIRNAMQRATVELDTPDSEPKERDLCDDKDPSKLITGNELKQALEMQGTGMGLVEIADKMGKSMPSLRARIAQHKKKLRAYPKDVICRKCGTLFRAETPDDIRCEACEIAALGDGS